MQEQPRHPLLSRFWAPDATTTNDDLALAKEKVKQLEAALSQLQNKLKDEEIGKQILECKLQKQHIDLTSTIEQLVDQKTNAEARAVYHKKSADHASETLKAIKDQHNIELVGTKDPQPGRSFSFITGKAG
ncbi:hypothetical protein BCR43DRAFT_152392 [Syncephalastrum racemosum]|uniref:Uncharacterized protein n=1 Tax=Syncephalastrum racemosum TaxID=13706 RepID=A0A1X2HN24_SYNRA|nr:hypothetical protein BCR43DRAFT_152392 [Syncephalastrum racemosum]